MLTGLGLLLLVVLTVATGFFVAQEFAFIAVDRAKLRQRADAGDRSAARALRVTARLSFMLSGAQLGITVTALLAGYAAEPFLGRGLAHLFGAAGLPAAVSTGGSVVLAMVLATVVQMVVGELAPKNWAIARPEALARALSGPTLAYLAVAGPVIRCFDATANRLLRALGVEPVRELAAGAAPDELRRIIAESHSGGRLDGETAALLERGLAFAPRTAAEVMVPRVDTLTMRGDEPAVGLVALLDSGHSRFPVIAEDVDDVIGVASLTGLLALPADRRPTARARDIAAEPLLVPQSLPLPDLLERLRGAHRQFAVVLDEHGGFAGVVTLEDVVEELVGAIRDEDDPPEPVAVRHPDGSWLVPARWRLDEIGRATGVRLPEANHYDTVSGLVLYHLGRVPAPDDRVELDNGLVLHVVEVERHVPATVRILAPQMAAS